MAGKTTTASGGQYKAVVGINFPPNDTRVEAGEVTDKIPADAIADLLAIGAIEPAGKPTAKAGK